MNWRGSRIGWAVLWSGAVLLSVAAAVTAGWRLLAERELQRDRVDLQAMEHQFTELRVAPRPQVEAAPSLLAASADVTGTLRELERAGAVADVRLSQVRPVAAQALGQQDFRVAGTAPTANVCRLLAAIERSPRSLMVRGARVRATDAEAIAFEIDVATYHRLGATR